MHDALVVRRRERARDLARHAQRLGLRQRPARDPLGERLALHELHHQVVDRRAVPARSLSDLVNDRDPRVAERGEQTRFALEARQPVAGVGDLLGQDLDRHLTPEARIQRPVHFAHAPASERALDLVRPELLPDLEAHRVRSVEYKELPLRAGWFWPRIEAASGGPTPMPARRSTLAVAFVIASIAAAAEAAEPDAAKIYAKTCALCHGPAGQPNEMFAKMGVRSFKDPEWQKATPEAQIEKSIREGKKGTLMASFEKQFTPEEIKALVAHVRKLGPPPAK